jgi:hypothetical protein
MDTATVPDLYPEAPASLCHGVPVSTPTTTSPAHAMPRMQGCCCRETAPTSTQVSPPALMVLLGLLGVSSPFSCPAAHNRQNTLSSATPSKCQHGPAALQTESPCVTWPLPADMPAPLTWCPTHPTHVPDRQDHSTDCSSSTGDGLMMPTLNQVRHSNRHMLVRLLTPSSHCSSCCIPLYSSPGSYST